MKSAEDMTTEWNNVLLEWFNNETHYKDFAEAYNLPERLHNPSSIRRDYVDGENTIQRMTGVIEEYFMEKARMVQVHLCKLSIIAFLPWRVHSINLRVFTEEFTCKLELKG